MHELTQHLLIFCSGCPLPPSAGRGRWVRDLCLRHGRQEPAPAGYHPGEGPSGHFGKPVGGPSVGLTNAAKTGPLPVAAYSALLMTITEGKCYSEQEMADFLVRAGFSNVEHFPTVADRSVITARKAMNSTLH
jgi:hypothetical protein